MVVNTIQWHDNKYNRFVTKRPARYQTHIHGLRLITANIWSEVSRVMGALLEMCVSVDVCVTVAGGVRGAAVCLKSPFNHLSS